VWYEMRTAKPCESFPIFTERHLRSGAASLDACLIF